MWSIVDNSKNKIPAKIMLWAQIPLEKRLWKFHSSQNSQKILFQYKFIMIRDFAIVCANFMTQFYSWINCEVRLWLILGFPFNFCSKFKIKFDLFDVETSKFHKTKVHEKKTSNILSNFNFECRQDFDTFRFKISTTFSCKNFWMTICSHKA